jgi:molybdopterin molybdotransferase
VEVAPRTYALRAEFDWSKPGNRREYLRARLEPGEPGAAGVVLYPNQGSGVLTSAAWADGLVEIPESRTVRRGETVKFIPFSSLFC